MFFIKKYKVVLCKCNANCIVLDSVFESCRGADSLSTRGHVHYLGGPRSLARSDGQMGCPVRSVI